MCCKILLKEISIDQLEAWSHWNDLKKIHGKTAPFLNGFEQSGTLSRVICWQMWKFPASLMATPWCPSRYWSWLLPSFTYKTPQRRRVATQKRDQTWFLFSRGEVFFLAFSPQSFAQLEVFNVPEFAALIWEKKGCHGCVFFLRGLTNDIRMFECCFFEHSCEIDVIHTVPYMKNTRCRHEHR